MILPQRRVPPLFFHACLDIADKWIEKHLASGLETDAALGFVCGRLVRVPEKLLTAIKEIDVHRNVYTLYSNCSLGVNSI